MQPGGESVLAGFGSSEDPRGLQGTKREVIAPITEVGLELAIGELGLGTCGGDSGGRAFVRVEGLDGSERRLAGALSSGTNEGCGLGYYTDLARFVGWVENASVVNDEHGRTVLIEAEASDDGTGVQFVLVELFDDQGAVQSSRIDELPLFQVVLSVPEVARTARITPIAFIGNRTTAHEPLIDATTVRARGGCQIHAGSAQRACACFLLGFLVLLRLIRADKSC